MGLGGVLNNALVIIWFFMSTLGNAAFDGQQLTSFLNEVLQDFNCIETAALTVGVVVDDPREEFAISLGKRDVAEGLEVDDDTLFGIGSTTKAMTAIVTDKVLRDQGYTWDTPIVSIFPALKLPGKNRTEKVTFRDLFSHTTCIRRSDFWWTSGPQEFDIEDMMGKLQFLTEDCKFRSKFNYNNLMYVTGAYIIEQLAGKSWSTLLNEIIFTPMGMTQTKATFEEAYKTENIVKGYTPHDGKFVELPFYADKIIDLVRAAGSVHSTASDMNKYMRHLLQDEDGTYTNLFWDTKIFDIGKYFGVTDKLEHPPFPATANMRNYTISWVLGEYQEEEILTHGGDTFTTHTVITLSRDGNYGIYTSSTGGNKARVANQLITWYIQDMINGNQPWINVSNICSYPDPWNTNQTPDNDDGKKIEDNDDKDDYIPDTSPELAELAGIYTHQVFGNVTVLFDDDHGLNFQYHMINCTLLRKSGESRDFRCHANVPHLPADTSILKDERTLKVFFKNGNLQTNMMENVDPLYQFNKSYRPTLDIFLALILHIASLFGFVKI